ncbi:integrase, catalytic region, zinc finger, CCHC-type containing protein [Tanacetum coccineum]
MHADVESATVNNNFFVHDNLEIERLEHENDHLFELLLSQDIVYICVNSLATRSNFREMKQSYIDEYNETLELKAQLAKKEHMIEKTVFNELALRCSRLKNRCVSLELKLKHQKESFMNTRPLNNQDALEFQEFFIINYLQAKLKAKDVSIANLKKHIADLKAKSVPNESISNQNVITLGMFKLDLEPLSSKLLKNRDTHIDYIKHTQEHADTLREIVKHARALKPLDSDLDSACKYATRIQEVLVYVSATCPSLTKASEKLVAVTPLNKNKNVRFAEPATSSSNTKKQVDSHNTQDSNPLLLTSIGMKSSTSSSRSQPSDNTKKNMISRTTSSRTLTTDGNRCPLTKIISTNVVPPKSPLPTKVTKKKTPRKNNPEMLKDVTNISLNSSSKGVEFKISNNSEPNQNWGSNVSTTPSSPRLINFVNKFLGTVKFGNDQIAKIMGYSDYQIDNVTISRVYYVEGSRGSNLYTLSIKDMINSSPICLMSKASNTKPMRVESINEKKYISVIVYDYSRFTWVKFLRSKDEALEFIIKFLKRIQVCLNTTWRILHNRTTLSKDETGRRSHSRYVDISKAPLFLCAEAVAIACYTQNRSLIRLLHVKPPYELLLDKKPNLTYFHVFGALCYLTNDCEDLGKLKPKANIGIFIGYAPVKKAYQIYSRCTQRIIETIHVNFDELTTMAFEQFGLGPEPQLLTPGTISSGLVQNPPSPTPYVPPTKYDWEILFQPLFDEYFNPPPYVASLVPAVVAPEPADPTDIPSSASIDQDAPSPSTSQTPQESQSPFIPSCVEE